MTHTYKLSDVFDLQMGKTPSRDIKEYWQDGEYEWISIADLTKSGKYICETKEKISQLAVEESGIRRIPSNTVIMSFKLSIGKVAITKKSIFSNEAIMAFIDKGVVSILPQYAYYLFSAQTWDKGVNRAVMGTTLNKATLSQYRISLHDKEIQLEIVEKLDKISELIAARKEQLCKVDDLVKSQFIEMFDGKNFPEKTLNELSFTKGEYGAQSASIPYDEKRPRYVRITDINEDGTLNDDFVSSINTDDDTAYKLSEGDFLFARMGATVGKTYAYKNGNEIFAGYLIRYKLNRQIIVPEYLFWFTKSPTYLTWVKLNQSGAAQPGINAKKYGLMKIPVPPIEEQRRFTRFVEQTDKSKVPFELEVAA